MRISKKSEYGLQATVELARVFQEGPVSARTIAKNQDIPLQYLEQIFSCLKKRRIIKTTRGPKGGYMLAEAPSKITVSDIIMALEKDRHFIVECIGSNKPKPCSRIDSCNTVEFWRRLSVLISSVLKSTSLEDLCKIAYKGRRAAKIEHTYTFQI